MHARTRACACALTLLYHLAPPPYSSRQVVESAMFTQTPPGQPPTGAVGLYTCPVQCVYIPSLPYMSLPTTQLLSGMNVPQA